MHGAPARRGELVKMSVRSLQRSESLAGQEHKVRAKEEDKRPRFAGDIELFPGKGTILVWIFFKGEEKTWVLRG